MVGRHTGALMLFLVVILDIGLNSLKEVKACISRVEVNVVVVEVFPDSFNPGVVGGSAFAIHGYVDFLGLQEAYPCRTGVLRPLVGVVYFRHAVESYRRFQHIQAPLFAHAVADAPSHDFPGIDINKSNYILEALGHWYMGNIGTIYLIGALNFQAA
jgi:hypothetical protein